MHSHFIRPVEPGLLYRLEAYRTVVPVEEESDRRRDGGDRQLFGRLYLLATSGGVGEIDLC